MSVLDSLLHFGQLDPFLNLCGLGEKAFSPSPQRFKKGSNCPKCNSESKTDKSIYIREDIITEFIKIHGDQYDYSKVIYKTKGKKVIFFVKNMENSYNHLSLGDCKNSPCFLQKK